MKFKSLMEKELLPRPINTFYVGSDKFNDFKSIWSLHEKCQLNFARKKF